MWKTKTWKFTERTMNQARARMEAWLAANKGRIQFEEIFVNNAFAIQYRVLQRIEWSE